MSSIWTYFAPDSTGRARPWPEYACEKHKQRRKCHSLAGKKAHSTWIHNALSKARNMMGEG